MGKAQKKKQVGVRLCKAFQGLRFDAGQKRKLVTGSELSWVSSVWEHRSMYRKKISSSTVAIQFSGGMRPPAPSFHLPGLKGNRNTVPDLKGRKGNSPKNCLN